MVTESKKAFIRQTLADCRLEKDSKGNGYWLHTPDYEVEDYPKFKLMLTDLGGQWKRKGFFFSANPLPALQLILDRGISWKQLTQYFPTPHPVVKQMIDCLPTGSDFWHGKRILEPSAGRGNILMNILLYTGLLRLNESRTGIEFLPKSTVHLCELDEFNYVCLENRVPREMGYERVGTDFLQLSEEQQYDIILANPPFTGNQWLTHFRKMVRHLAPGGRIVCVLPQKAEQEPGLLDGLVDGNIIPLPKNSFKSSGTSADTCIVSARRSGEPVSLEETPAEVRFHRHKGATGTTPIPVRQAPPAAASPPPSDQPRISRHGQFCLF